MKPESQSSPKTTCYVFAAVLLITFLNIIGCSNKPKTAAVISDPESFSGNPPICPRWVFEPWVWEDNVNTQQAAEKLINGYLSRNIPVGAIIIDSPWETYYNSFEWDRKLYPNPEQMISDFNKKGVHVIMWVTGYVNVDNPEYDFVKEKGYVVDGGKDYGWWKGKGVHMDFTNPEAMKWWQSKMDNIFDMGVDGWKVDVGESSLGNKIQTYAGEITKKQFKGYYYGGMLDYSLNKNPKAMIVARPFSWQDGFGAPIPKCTVGWCGDFTGDWAGLQHQLDNIYRSAQADYAVLNVEVGGFMQINPNKDQLIRYAQLGAMMPVMNNGGANGAFTNHLPWFHDEQTTHIYRYFATLHSELVPYLFSYGVDSHLKGTAIVKNSDIPKAHHKLGNEFFVSVVTVDTVQKAVTFPEGDCWIDYWDQSKVYKGGTTSEYYIPLEKYPIFIRAGAIIPMNVRNSVTGHGDKTSNGKQTIVIYPSGKSTAAYHIPSGDGIKYSDVTINVDEQAGTVTVKGKHKQDYRLRIKSFDEPATVKNADTYHYDSKSNFVIIDKNAKKFTIKINGLKGYSSKN